MDVITGLKSELFRPLATLILPGAAAFTPYLFVIAHYNPKLVELFENHEGAFGTAVGLIVLAVGFVLENIGSRIESGSWDERIEAKTGCQQGDWKEYLRLQWKPGEEPIAQRYLRGVLVKMKFELAFGLAMFFGWFGLLWLKVIRNDWSSTAFAIFSFFFLLGAMYLLYESYGSAWLLADARHLMLHQKPLERARPSLEKASEHMRWVLSIDAVYSAGASIVLLLIPNVPLSFVVPSVLVDVSPGQRVLGGAFLGFAVVILYISRLPLIGWVRGLAACLFFAHLVRAVTYVLPLQQGGIRPPAVLNLIVTGVLIFGYGWVAAMRAPRITSPAA